MKLFTFLHNQWDLRRLKRTKKSRQVLRAQKYIVHGNVITSMDYADFVASTLPMIIDSKGHPIDHKMRIRKSYMLYDMPGIQYYAKSILRTAKYMKTE